MVQYFAEHLSGFATTRHGWVQSYGSRCTRPPILHGDVSRPAPITVRWARVRAVADRPAGEGHAHRARDDRRVVVRPPRPTASRRGVAGGGRSAEEVRDLQTAGIGVIQVDEPALRELLPLRAQEQADYLSWAVEAYQRATSAAEDGTQIHTHLCYSNASEVIDAIDALDADVTSIESARSGARILAEPSVAAFARGLGPGVYDIHSPRVPGTDEVADLLATAIRGPARGAGVGQPGLWAQDPHVSAGRGGADQCGHRGPAPTRRTLKSASLCAVTAREPVEA